MWATILRILKILKSSQLDRDYAEYSKLMKEDNRYTRARRESIKFWQNFNKKPEE